MDNKDKNKKEKDTDLVDEAGKESFPASDPPSWTSGRKKEKDDDKKSSDKKNPS